MPQKTKPDPFVTHYSQLVGHKVVNVVRDVGDNETYGLLFSNGATAWVMCDPEGNGPGFLDIQESDPTKN